MARVRAFLAGADLLVLVVFSYLWLNLMRFADSDAATIPPTLTEPAGNQFTFVTVSYTLPEPALVGSVKLVLNATVGVDNNAPHTIAFGLPFPSEQGPHSFSIRGISLLGGFATSVTSRGPLSWLVSEVTYSAVLQYQDVAGNAIAHSNMNSMRYSKEVSSL
jgi:hypothetical protein